MNKNIILLAAGAVMLSAASCSVEESKLTPVASDPRVPMEFTTLSTKTALVPSTNDVIWSADDAVAIFDGTYANRFTITSEPGTSSATFAGKAIPEADYYAIYPFSNDAKLNGTVISSVLPAEQHYVAGTFDTMLNPSVAKALGGATELSFSNVASILQVNVTGLTEGKSVREIQLKSETSLTGPYTVDLNDETVEATASGEEISGARLVSETGENLGAGPYYFVVLPGTHNLTISVIYSDNTYSTVTKDAVEMPVSGGRSVSIDASAAVTIENGLYGQYQAGLDIEIGGKLYNKALWGEATLISEDTEIIGSDKEQKHPGLTTVTPVKNDGIYFIESGIDVYMNYEGAARNFFLIGNDPDNKSTVIPDVYLRTNVNGAPDGTGELMLYNIEMDCTGLSGYAITQNNSTPGRIRVIECKIALGKGPLVYCGNVENQTRYYTEIDLQGNNVKLSAGTIFMNMGNNKAVSQNLIFKNNIFYSASGVLSGYRIFAGQNAEISKITMENNSIVNVTNGTTALFLYATLNEVELRNNFVYLESQNSGMCIFRPQDVSQTEGVYPGNPKSGVCEDSIFYSPNCEINPNDKNGNEYGKQWFYSGMNRVELTVEKEFTVIEDNPFVNLDIAGENFALIDTYASFGAQR